MSKSIADDPDDPYTVDPRTVAEPFEGWDIVTLASLASLQYVDGFQYLDEFQLRPIPRRRQPDRGHPRKARPNKRARKSARKRQVKARRRSRK